MDPMDDIRIVDVTVDNVGETGLFCLRNPRHPGFRDKAGWLSAHRVEGLRLKVLYSGTEAAGFIEYVPAEKAWRPVEAPGHLFIHCLWVYPKKFLGQGVARRLVEECLREAEQAGKNGVAVTVSKGSWMAGPDLFLKLGFAVAEEKGRFVLLSRTAWAAEAPRFRDWEGEAGKYRGLHLVYAHQCPLFCRSVDEMRKTAREHGHELQVTLLRTAEEAQRAPSGYGVYNLVYDGRVLADHYISNTRFRNILTKELNS